MSGPWTWAMFPERCVSSRERLAQLLLNRVYSRVCRRQGMVNDFIRKRRKRVWWH